jgi:hypothetical protein
MSCQLWVGISTFIIRYYDAYYAVPHILHSPTKDRSVTSRTRTVQFNNDVEMVAGSLQTNHQRIRTKSNHGPMRPPHMRDVEIRNNKNKARCRASVQIRCAKGSASDWTGGDRAPAGNSSSWSRATVAWRTRCTSSDLLAGTSLKSRCDAAAAGRRGAQMGRRATNACGVGRGGETHT